MFEYTGKRKIQTRLRWSSTPASPELFANLLDTDTESRALGLGRPILILGQFHQKSTTFARIRSAFFPGLASLQLVGMMMNALFSLIS
jgi:hypothetical protein